VTVDPSTREAEKQELRMELIKRYGPDRGASLMAEVQHSNCHALTLSLREEDRWVGALSEAERDTDLDFQMRLMSLNALRGGDQPRRAQQERKAVERLRSAVVLPGLTQARLALTLATFAGTEADRQYALADLEAHAVPVFTDGPFYAEVCLVRAEVERLVSEPLDGCLARLEEAEKQVEACRVWKDYVVSDAIACNRMTYLVFQGELDAAFEALERHSWSEQPPYQTQGARTAAEGYLRGRAGAVDEAVELLETAIGQLGSTWALPRACNRFCLAEICFDEAGDKAAAKRHAALGVELLLRHGYTTLADAARGKAAKLLRGKYEPWTFFRDLKLTGGPVVGIMPL